MSEKKVIEQDIDFCKTMAEMLDIKCKELDDICVVCDVELRFTITMNDINGNEIESIDILSMNNLRVTNKSRGDEYKINHVRMQEFIEAHFEAEYGKDIDV